MPLLRQSVVLVSTMSLVAVTMLADRDRARETSSDAEKNAVVHAHFDSVLAELQAHDVAELPRNQQVRRTALIGALRAYNTRGQYPKNYDFPDEPTPYFVDRKTGVRCAVAHLLESTGRHDIVQRVAASNINVRVMELAGDTAFISWVEQQGITLAEAARIQPKYEGSQGNDGIGTATVVAVAGASLLSVGTSIGTSIWNTSGNADGHSRAGNVIGVVSGALTTIVGTTIALSADNSQLYGGGVATAAVGGLGVVLGIRGSARRSRTTAALREAERVSGSVREGTQASIHPIIGVGRNAATGLSMRIRF